MNEPDLSKVLAAVKARAPDAAKVERAVSRIAPLPAKPRSLTTLPPADSSRRSTFRPHPGRHVCTGFYHTAFHH